MNKTNRYVIPLIIAITAAPFVTAWFLLNYTQAGRSAEPGHGRLIDPPRTLNDAALFDPSAEAGAQHLYGKWSLLYLAQGGCDAACLDDLRRLRELRLGTGKDMHRVQRVLVVFRPTPDRPEMAIPLPGDLRGQLLVPASDLAEEPRSTFALAADDQPLTAGRIYLVDPLGRMMMAYPAGADAAGIVRDLKRLLRYSRIG